MNRSIYNKKWLLITVLFVFHFVFTFVSLVKADEIKIGAFLPITGDMARIANIEKNSLLLAVDEINARGGIKGVPLKLLVKDTKSNINVTKMVLDELISKEKVLALVGGDIGSVVDKASAFAQKSKIPILIHRGESGKVTEHSWGYVFSISQPIDEHFDSFLDFIFHEISPLSTIGIYYQQIPNGCLLFKELLNKASYFGIKILVAQSTPLEEKNLKHFVSHIKKISPDIFYLYLTEAEDLSLLNKYIKEMNIRFKIIVGDDGLFLNPKTLKIMNESCNNLFFISTWDPAVPYPGARAYYESYIERFKSIPDHNGVQAYSAIYVIKDALLRSTSLSRKDICEALRGTDIMTPMGPVRFVSYGKKRQQNIVKSLIIQWINGHKEIIWPLELATSYPEIRISE